MASGFGPALPLPWQPVDFRFWPPRCRGNQQTSGCGPALQLPWQPAHFLFRPTAAVATKITMRVDFRFRPCAAVAKQPGAIWCLTSGSGPALPLSGRQADKISAEHIDVCPPLHPGG